MFVMTAKLSKPKLFAAAVILVGVIVAIVMLLTGQGATVPSLPDGNSHEARAAYLATYGWSIDGIPKETQTVTIPDATENKVFARYNELQKDQGFDLLPYTGKEVIRYVYEILNYPDGTAPVYAGVLVFEGKIIGGEITDTSPNGVMHGFRKPGSAPAPETSNTESTAETTPPTDTTDPTASTEATEPRSTTDLSPTESTGTPQ